MKSTRKRQNPKKKTEEKKMKQMGIKKGQRKKGRQREEREVNNKTQTCAFCSTHIGIGVSCLLSNFLIDLGKKNWWVWGEKTQALPVFPPKINQIKHPKK